MNAIILIEFQLPQFSHFCYFVIEFSQPAIAVVHFVAEMFNSTMKRAIEVMTCNQ